MFPQVFLCSDSCSNLQQRPVVAIGSFDGVHLGHQALLGRLRELADELQQPAMVYTFEPLPREVLRGREPVPRMLSLADRVRLLGEHGVDQVCIEQFSQAFSRHPAQWFADEVIGRRLHPSAMVVGHDFRFGSGRGGDECSLRKGWPGLHVESVTAFELDGSPVSSSRIRSLLLAGEVATAGELMGRPHFMRGTVVKGQGMGRKLGFPTANLLVSSGLVPGRGVYAVRVRVDRGDSLPAVANMGIRPTFSGRRLVPEVHLLVPDGAIADAGLYGHELEVGFVAWIRREQRFSGRDELMKRIRVDISKALGLL